jgi:sialate O-acetylesterase
MSGKILKLMAGGAALAVSATLCADVKLSNIFSDNMVFQRDAEVPVWGWAAPGEKVTVKIAGKEVPALPDTKGRWLVKLPAMGASSAPLEMTVSGKNTVTVKNILVGEVWLCSGQSNMGLMVGRALNPDKETAAADYPLIRQFRVSNTLSAFPQDNVIGSWSACSPETVKIFTAAGYFFAREIYKKLNVPVGIINSSWGGSRIEPWTAPEGFAAEPEFEGPDGQPLNYLAVYKSGRPAYLDKIEKWVKDAREAAAKNENPADPMPTYGFTEPCAIFNTMINPIAGYTIKGAIWYQGESNHADKFSYYFKMKALIGGWRRIWGEGDFPFYFAQLAPFNYKAGEDLPLIWEAQTKALDIPNTGMIITNDITENIKDIHPRNKQDVGKRLAALALARTYGFKDTVFSGPVHKSSKTDGEKIVIEFDCAGSCLASRDKKELTCFEIAGPDKNFAKAEAKITGKNTVEVSSPDVKAPVAVRFAWDEIAQPNLMSSDGLPAGAFRTDSPNR